MTKEEIILWLDENKKGFTQSDVELLERFAQSQLTEKDKQIEELKAKYYSVSEIAHKRGQFALEALRENLQFEAQIEKMKCCNNCEFDNLEPPEVISNGVCENCINHSKWELEY